MKKISLFIFLLLPSISLLATIRIISTSPATASCNGGIYVEATGTAGPFSLKITNASGYLLERAMSSPTESITGLCSGEYTVQVFNAFGCAKTLLAEVSAGAGLLSQLAPQKQDEQAALSSIWKAKAYPNPFSTDFQVELDWDRLQTEAIQVEVLNALGQVVKTQQQSLVQGRNVFRVELNDPSSRGLLQVVLRDKSGRQIWLKVVQVQR
ncbi:T9SS type A sorting domain-containing protein [Haliscomenobacter sp.]|uniref:T9SS type A sorting domain-containing protein n=1 Tax=Haliscomenobacter sp. TaxID=2717303 RepID=UPI003364DCE4